MPCPADQGRQREEGPHRGPGWWRVQQVIQDVSFQSPFPAIRSIIILRSIPQNPEPACHRFKAALEAADGITMGHLKENSKSVFSGFNLFGSVPDTDAGRLLFLLHLGKAGLCR